MNVNSEFIDFVLKRVNIQTIFNTFSNKSTLEKVLYLFINNYFFLVSIITTLIIIIRKNQNTVVLNLFSKKVNEIATTRQRQKVYPTFYIIIIFIMKKFLDNCFIYKEITLFFENSSLFHFMNFIFYHAIIVSFILIFIIERKRFCNLFKTNLYINIVLIFANNLNNDIIIKFFNYFKIDLNFCNFFLSFVLFLIGKIIVHIILLLGTIYLDIVLNFIKKIFFEHAVLFLIFERFCEKQLESADKGIRWIFYLIYLVTSTFNKYYLKQLKTDDNIQLVIVEL